jgi:hypothetical protein
MFEYLRRALEPTACQVFPIKLLWFPLIYWFLVFLYFYFTTSGNTTLLTVIKISTIQMFKNGFYQNHPSVFLPSIVLVVLFILEFVCAFPITKP